MSKQLLIDTVAEQLGGTKADAAKAVDAVATALNSLVGSGERVVLSPLGTFALKHKAARTARNPRTGETVQVLAKTVVGFKPTASKA